MRAHLMAVLSCAAALGCAEASVAVDFEVPSAYRPVVASVVYSVLTPLTPFSCEGIVWGEVGDDLIQNSQLTEVKAPLGARVPLSGIPRLGAKVFYAQGLSAEQTPIVAACGDLGDIDGDVHLTLEGEPVASVTLPQAVFGEALPQEVRVVVNDALGEPLAGVPLRWTVVGPRAETITGPADLVTEGRGVALIQPTEPSLPGPNALDIAVRWARPAPPSILGYREPTDVIEGDLPAAPSPVAGAAPEALYAVGRIGPAGEPGFVALGPPSDTLVRQALIAYRDGASVQTVTTGSIAGAVSLGRLRGATRDQVVSLTTSDWIEIRPDGSTPVVASSSLGRPALRLAVIGPCSGAGEGFLAWFANGSFAAFDGSLGPVTSPFVTAADPAWRLIGSGCVAGPTDPVRAVVFSQSQVVQQIVAEMDTIRSGPWFALPAGVAFLPAIGEEPPLLIGSTLRIDGTAVSRVRLAASTGARLVPDLVAEDESTSIAIASAGGDFDGDGHADVASLLSFGESDLGDGVNLRFLVSLAVPHRGGRLVGLSGSVVARNPGLLVYDFDQDGTDDLLLATPSRFAVALLHP